MAQSNHRRSAEIIQFPAGGRRAVAARSGDVAPTLDASLKNVMCVAASGAWYHEAAMEEVTSHKH